MAGYRHVFVSLRIFGRIKDFEKLTKALSVRPDYCHKQGERANAKSRLHERDTWQVKTPISRTRPLAEHLRWMHKRFQNRVALLKRLTSSYDIDLYCSYHSDFDQGLLEYPPAITELCSKAGIPLRISILVQ